LIPKYLIILSLSFLPNITFAQQLPPLDSLLCAVENYYKQYNAAQITEFLETTKMRWLNYLPSPVLYPFDGYRIGFNFNLSAPIQEIRIRNLSKNRIASITRRNQLDCQDTRQEVYVTYLSIKALIQLFQAKDSLSSLNDQIFQIAKSQYERNELTPSAFIASQNQYFQYKLNRQTEYNSIIQSIYQLQLKAKAVRMGPTGF
jgi:hypothetical protein